MEEDRNNQTLHVSSSCEVRPKKEMGFFIFVVAPASIGGGGDDFWIYFVVQKLKSSLPLFYSRRVSHTKLLQDNFCTVIF